MQRRAPRMIRLPPLVAGALLVLAACSHAAATTLARHAAPTDVCEATFHECVLRFERQFALPTFALHGTDDNVAFTPPLVWPRKQLGIVNSNALIPQFIERARRGGGGGGAVQARNVTQFGLTPTQFKPLTMGNGSTSGVAHETFQTHVRVAKRRCVRLFFTSWQILRSGVVVDNVNLTPEQAVAQSVCVVFRTS
eukprot:TRINITY_DN1035_c1_g1_i1.p1 TRINITY_DN1035_c1_g1~~TRINITY_DN1035_c1_g1_i1.p1  ORF type:complete len:195 (+),score=46.63 TRINITY_DN1035_c1_g1_i1:66-650(+)